MSFAISYVPSLSFQVYLARDTVSKMDVAVKVCEKSHIYRERMQKAILREKHIMRILTETPSPFIIQLYCTFQDETRLCNVLFCFPLYFF